LRGHKFTYLLTYLPILYRRYGDKRRFQ